MCGLCGLLESIPNWSDPIKGNNTLPLRQLRYQQINIINKLIAIYRCKINDCHGSYYILATATGKQIIIYNLQQLWYELSLLNIHCDPLNIEYLNKLPQTI